MINELSNINDHQSQVHKQGNRNKDIAMAGTQTEKSGGYDIRDVVEISNLKPVQPVTEDKNEINFSSDARNSEKNIEGSESAGGPIKAEDSNNPAPDVATFSYGYKEHEIGMLINKVV